MLYLNVRPKRRLISYLFALFVLAFAMMPAMGQPVSAWSLDEVSGVVASDAVGGNNFDLLNGPSWRTGEGRDGALLFDGVNDYGAISEANLSGLIPASGSNPAQNFSITAWIKPAALDKRNPILAKQGTSANGNKRGFVFMTGEGDSAGKLYFEVYKNDTVVTALASSVTLSVAQWQHVAVTYSYLGDGSSQIRMYVNGQQVGSSNNAVGPAQGNPQPLHLGAYLWNSSYKRFFQGLLDDVRVYSDTLSQAGVQAIFAGNDPIGPVPPDVSGELSKWPLNESTGTRAADSIGSNDFNLVNGPVWRTTEGLGGALAFDGLNDSGVIADSNLSGPIPASSRNPTTDFSVTAWIKPSSLDKRRPILAKQGTTASGKTRGFLLTTGEGSAAGRLYAEVFKNDSSATEVTSSASLVVGQWQHVAMTYDFIADGSSIVRLYLNGRQVGATNTAVGPVQGNPQPLNLGAYNWNSTYKRYFHGLLDEVRLFGQALTSAQIQAIADDGGSVDPEPPNVPPTASIVASPTTGPAPLTVNFDSVSNDSDGIIVRHGWTFGDGASAVGKTVSHTYTAAGTYTARVTVTDDDGATASASVIISVGSGGSGTDPDLRVEIAPNASSITMENSRLQVVWGPHGPTVSEFSIREFRLKRAGNENQANAYLDANSGRGTLSEARIVVNSSTEKKIRLSWNQRPNTCTSVSSKIVQEISIFPNEPYLKIYYENLQGGISIVDLGSPGGATAGRHVVHGSESWIRSLAATHDESPATKGSYYNRFPADGVNDPINAGSLNYNGDFVLGVHNPVNGRGFGRVMPVSSIPIVKLLLRDSMRRGLEFFPNPFCKPHAPFTGYLYAVEGGGAAEILSTGRRLGGAN